jgi:hypothetical protein
MSGIKPKINFSTGGSPMYTSSDYSEQATPASMSPAPPPSTPAPPTSRTPGLSSTPPTSATLARPLSLSQRVPAPTSPRTRPTPPTKKCPQSLLWQPRASSPRPATPPPSTSRPKSNNRPPLAFMSNKRQRVTGAVRPVGACSECWPS